MLTHNGKEVVIEYTPFPESIRGKVKGFLSASVKFDCWLICIDSELSPQAQRHCLGHELAHLFLDHLDSKKPIPEIEAEANRRAWEFYRAYKNGKLETASL